MLQVIVADPERVPGESGRVRLYRILVDVSLLSRRGVE